MEYLITNKGKRLSLRDVSTAYPVSRLGSWQIEVLLKPIPFTISEAVESYRVLEDTFNDYDEANRFAEEINESIS